MAFMRLLLLILPFIVLACGYYPAYWQKRQPSSIPQPSQARQVYNKDQDREKEPERARYRRQAERDDYDDDDDDDDDDYDREREERIAERRERERREEDRNRELAQQREQERRDYLDRQREQARENQRRGRIEGEIRRLERAMKRKREEADGWKVLSDRLRSGLAPSPAQIEKANELLRRSERAEDAIREYWLKITDLRAQL